MTRVTLIGRNQQRNDELNRAKGNLLPCSAQFRAGLLRHTADNAIFEVINGKDTDHKCVYDDSIVYSSGFDGSTAYNT